MSIKGFIIIMVTLMLSVSNVIAQDYNIIRNPDDETLNKIMEDVKKFQGEYDLKGANQIGNNLNLNNPSISKDMEDKLYYFISFSMPAASLKQAVSDAEKYGIHLVIRGLYNDDFMETAKKIQGLIGGKRVEVLIDPILFEIYKIGECKGCSGVPTLVYAKSVDTVCENCSGKGDAVKISGNVTIEYALNKIIEKDSGAAKYLKKEYVNHN